MVEMITQYKTFDGKKFDKESDAVEWEHRTNRAMAIKSMFPNTNKLRLGDYYRIPMNIIADARNKFADNMKTEVGESYSEAIEYFRNGGRGGLVGRLLCDGSSPFYSVFDLLESIDEEGRLFNQPYYATHPNEAGEEIQY